MSAPCLDDAGSITLRHAMRMVASTVSIVTTIDGLTPYGIAVTSFTSVSLDPPTILVCINKGSEFYSHLHRTRRFCINILGEKHGDLCHMFGTSSQREASFTVGDWRRTSGEVVLSDARAALRCKTFEEVACGTHVAVFASVESIELSEPLSDLLVYLNGRVRHLRNLNFPCVESDSKRRINRHG